METVRAIELIDFDIYINSSSINEIAIIYKEVNYGNDIIKRDPIKVRLR